MPVMRVAKVGACGHELWAAAQRVFIEGHLVCTPALSLSLSPNLNPNHRATGVGLKYLIPGLK